MENGVSTPRALTLNNSVVSNNYAGDAGGGVETDGSGKVFINGGSITGNTSVNQGAGIWLDAITASNGTVASATVTSGGTGYTSAPTVTINDPTGSGATGVATVVNGSVVGVTITNSTPTYTAPTISFSGGGGTGAAATADLVLQSANLNVTNTLIAGNHALSAVTGVGGGIGNAGNGAVVIANSTLKNNTAGGDGGGFSDQNNQGTLSVVDSYFLGNRAGAAAIALVSTGTGDGGAIQEGGPQTTIINTQIQGNGAGGAGGGLFIAGKTLFLESSTLTDNTAVSGGGGLELLTTGTGLDASTVTDCTITGNFADNNVPVNGGGIDDEATGDLVLQNDTINANVASGNGGGIFWTGGPGAFTVANTMIDSLTAAREGLPSSGRPREGEAPCRPAPRRHRCAAPTPADSPHC